MVLFHNMLATWNWKRGKFAAAAVHFEATEQWQEAAGCHEVTGQATKAASCYKKAGNLSAAARCYEQLCRWADAAKCHERSRNWRGLARCYEQLADWVKAARTYEKAGSLMAAARSFERSHRWMDAARCWNEMERYDEGGRCMINADRVQACLEQLAARTDAVDLEVVATDNMRLVAEITRHMEDAFVDGGFTVKDILQSLLVVNNPDTFSLLIQDGVTRLYIGLGVFAGETNVRLLLPQAQEVVAERYPRGAPVEL